MYCPKCESYYDDGSQFCGACGYKLEPKPIIKKIIAEYTSPSGTDAERERKCEDFLLIFELLCSCHDNQSEIDWHAMWSAVFSHDQHYFGNRYENASMSDLCTDILSKISGT